MIIPTETVYGLAANAFDPDAVSKIFFTKGRPANNPLIVHIASIDRLSQVAATPLPSSIERQIDSVSDLWPGPLTVVLPRSAKIPDIVTAGQSTVAIRVPSHPVALKLLARCDFPIAAPSANRSNYVSPTRAAHCEHAFEGGIEMIIDGGECEIGVESTIVSLEENGPRLLRPGGVTAEQLARRFSMSLDQFTRSCDEKHALLEAPGMMPAHYSPRTPIQIYSESSSHLYPPSRIGRILFRPVRTADSIRYAKVETLSSDGNLSDVAKNLFAAIRRMDDAGLDLILIDECEREGVGRAIMDRLDRATSSYPCIGNTQAIGE